MGNWRQLALQRLMDSRSHVVNYDYITTMAKLNVIREKFAEKKAELEKYTNEMSEKWNILRREEDTFKKETKPALDKFATDNDGKLERMERKMKLETSIRNGNEDGARNLCEKLGHLRDQERDLLKSIEELNPFDEFFDKIFEKCDEFCSVEEMMNKYECLKSLQDRMESELTQSLENVQMSKMNIFSNISDKREELNKSAEQLAEKKKGTSLDRRELSDMKNALEKLKRECADEEKIVSEVKSSLRGMCLKLRKLKNLKISGRANEEIVKNAVKDIVKKRQRDKLPSIFPQDDSLYPRVN